MPELRFDDDGCIDMAGFVDADDATGPAAQAADDAFRGLFELAPRATESFEGLPVVRPVEAISTQQTQAAVKTEVAVDPEVIELGAAHRARSGRPGRLLALAASAALLVGVAGYAAGWFEADSDGPSITAERPDGPQPGSPTSGNEDGEEDNVDATDGAGNAEQLTLEQLVEVGAGPREPTVADGYLWVPAAGDDTLSRVDPSTGDVQDIEVGTQLDRAVATDVALWVPVREDGELARVDLATQAVEKIAVGADPDTPVVVGDHVWVPVRGTNELLAIDRNAEV